MSRFASGLSSECYLAMTCAEGRLSGRSGRAASYLAGTTFDLAQSERGMVSCSRVQGTAILGVR